ESIQRIGQDRPTITQLMNVNDIIATLTENEQKVIMMYAAGYSTNEIAGIFDTVPSTVRSRIMWIRRRVQAGNS
ncbi:sigma factor-like helix-turn-helix DNA-binding protein, partial [Weissella soli]